MHRSVVAPPFLSELTSVNPGVDPETTMKALESDQQRLDFP